MATSEDQNANLYMSKIKFKNKIYILDKYYQK